jgi:hypothetical protein
MGTTEPARQFIMLPFRELDSPAFMRLARSPEFSTYLTLRRYIWRSHESHNCGIEQWYARGYLCCALSRARIAQCLGGQISIRSVCSDIARLIRQGAIRVAGSGRGQVFLLGRWEGDGEEYQEHYYLDEPAGSGDEQEETGADGTDAQPRQEVRDPERTSGADAQVRTELRGSDAENCAVPASAAQPGNELRGAQEESCAASAQKAAPKNRECLNREYGIEGDTPVAKSDDEIWKEVLGELRLQLLPATYDAWVARTTARRVDGHWEITCASAPAQDWLEHRLGTIIRRELAAAAGEEVGEVVFRTRDGSKQQPMPKAQGAPQEGVVTVAAVSREQSAG